MEEKYIHIDDLNVHAAITMFLLKNIKEAMKLEKDIFICAYAIDKNIGDSVGPLVGYKIRNMNQNKMIVCGSLENTFQALNIETVHNTISNSFDNLYIIAIDACLGDYRDIGKILLKYGSVRPGAGVNKKIPPVGDISIKAIVDDSDDYEFFPHKPMRLNFIMRFADIISEAILKVNSII